jgi:ferrous iron transport protein A
MNSLDDIKLNTLLPGQRGVIHAINAEQGLHQRLNALGFRVGKQIQLIRRANFNGPLHVRIGATDIIMRDIDAQRIQLDVAQRIQLDSAPRIQLSAA